MEERIRKAVADYLSGAGASETVFVIERPAHSEHGDYATNAALAASKSLGKNPRELADTLAQHLTEALPDLVSHASSAGPGFVNITLSREAVTFAVAEADAKKEEWGKSEATDEKVLIEYGNPNPFKEMHIGHLMGSIIGESLSRLIENDGSTVLRDTFGGDVGPHVAKALWALQKAGVADPESAKQIGEAYAEGSRAYEDDPQAKIEIDVLNKDIYAGTNRELMELWRKGRDISMEAFERIWRQYGTHFDYTFFDSDTTDTGLRVVKDGLEKGIFKESDGAVIYDGEPEGVHTMVFITSQGTPTYEAKDLGLAFLKEERCASDRNIILTANEQAGRFKTVLAALAKVAAPLAAKTTHITHGFLKLTEGKMSSREGNVITAEGLTNDVIARASEKNDDPLVAEQVAVGAIKCMVLRQGLGSDITFDFDKSLSLEGDSGPYLQYALVRAKSVLAQAGDNASGDAPSTSYQIERAILHYPEVAARAAEELAPHLLVTYLTELAGEWNSFYAKERIIGGEHEAHKLMIARAFVQTMTNGLTLLGIPTPEKM